MEIAFRPLRENDSGTVLTWRNTPDVAAHMYSDHAVSAAEHAGWLAEVLGDDGRRYWIILLDEEPVGLANLVGIDRHNRRADWGFYLGEATARGSGVGRAALYLVIEQAFGTLGLHRLTCSALVGNEAAWGLYESMGFVGEGRLRDHVWKGGQFHDVLNFALLADEWAAARPGVEAKLRAAGIDPAALEVREG